MCFYALRVCSVQPKSAPRRCGSPHWHVRPTPRPMLPNTHTHPCPTPPYPPTSRSTFAPPHPNHTRCSAATPISLKSLLTEEACFVVCAPLCVFGAGRASRLGTRLESSRTSAAPSAMWTSRLWSMRSALTWSSWTLSKRRRGLSLAQAARALRMASLDSVPSATPQFDTRALNT